MEPEIDYNFYGLNGEPEHNTDSILCWCAPVKDGDVVIHKSMAEIIDRLVKVGWNAAIEAHAGMMPAAPGADAARPDEPQE